MTGGANGPLEVFADSALVGDVVDAMDAAGIVRLAHAIHQHREQTSPGVVDSARTAGHGPRCRCFGQLVGEAIEVAGLRCGCNSLQYPRVLAWAERVAEGGLEIVGHQ